MRALVVYESMYGNTERLAHAVAHGLGEHADVTVVEVGEAPTAVPDDVDLLVVGGPTHAFSLSRPATRREAALQTEASLVSQRIGLREWLAGLARDHGGVRAAAFDSCAETKLSGSAGRAAARRLRRHGFVLAAPAEDFFVQKALGPLVDGEIDRARDWGAALAAGLAADVRAA